MSQESPRLRKGSVVRIKMVNFITFSDCEVKFGPRLNMILGPNGSGKSSIASALAAGLTGSMKIVGKGTFLADLIKRGEEFASIEVEIYGDGPAENPGNVIFQRVIHKDSTSTWKINKSKATEAEVKKICSQMNIDVTNLVQFLPQGKVDEFTALADDELLHATVTNLLGPDHMGMLAKINTLQQELRRTEVHIGGRIEELKQLERDHARLERTVSRYEGREQIAKEIELMSKLLPWIQLDELYDQLRQTRAEIESLPTESGDKSVPLKVGEALKQVSDEYEREKRKNEAVKKEFLKEKTNVESLNDDIESAVEEVGEQKMMLADFEKSKADDRAKIAKLEKKLYKINEDISQRRGEDYYLEELERVGSELREHTSKRHQLNLEKSQVASTLVRNQNLLRLMRMDATNDTSSTTSSDSSVVRTRQEASKEIHGLRVGPAEKQKLSQAREDALAGRGFKKPVHGPLICELLAKDDAVSKAFEYGMRSNTWKFFVAEDPQDHSLLMSRGISAILVTQPSTAPRPLDENAFRQLALRGYLNELLVGSPLAIEAAKRLSSLHNILVGTHETEKIFRQNPGLFSRLFQPKPGTSDHLVLFLPTVRVDCFRSRYGSRNTTLKTAVYDQHRAMHLPSAARLQQEQKDQQEAARNAVRKRLENVHNKDKLAEEVLRLQSRVNQLEPEVTSLDGIIQKLRDERQELNSGLAQERSLEIEKRKIEETLEELHHKLDSKNPNHAQKLQLTLERSQAQLAEKARELSDALGALKDAAVQMCVSKMTVAQLDREKNALQYLKADAERRFDKLSQRREELKKKVETLRNEMQAKKKVADSACSKEELERSELVNQVTELGIPLSGADLAEAIASRKLTLEIMKEHTQAVADYQRVVARMKELKEFLEKNERAYLQRKQSLAVEQENWREPVRDLTNKLNLYMKEAFKVVNDAGYKCAAEVALVHKDESDLSTYGIEIRVRFRDDHSLSKLDSMRQSGGERSMTSFLYILSMQRVAASPFVLVDEINQGLDPEKERLLFYCLADVAAKSKTQYFWVSPKLLPGLNYPRDARIHFVFNGPFALKQDEWNINRFYAVAKNGIKHRGSETPLPKDASKEQASKSTASLPKVAKRSDPKLLQTGEAKPQVAETEPQTTIDKPKLAVGAGLKVAKRSLPPGSGAHAVVLQDDLESPVVMETAKRAKMVPVKEKDIIEVND